MENSDSRLLIVGCGGIGGVLGASLHASGRALHIATPNEAVRQCWAKTGPFLNSRQIRPSLPTSRLFESVRAATGRFDIVFVAVQPPQIDGVAKSLCGKLTETGRVVCLSNGLCEQRLADTLGEERVLGAVVSWGAKMPMPGRYERTSRGGFLLGGLCAQPDEIVKSVESELTVMGPVTLTDNLRGARFGKLVINCAISALGTIGGDTLGSLLVRKEARELALCIMREAVAVARTEGLVLEKVANVDLEKLVGQDSSLWTDTATQHALLLTIGAKYRKLRSSMLASMERGREPAVDYLNGEISCRGQRCHIPTPYNSAARDVIWSIYRGELSPGLQALSELSVRAKRYQPEQAAQAT